MSAPSPSPIDLRTGGLLASAAGLVHARQLHFDCTKSNRHCCMSDIAQVVLKFWSLRLQMSRSQGVFTPADQLQWLDGESVRPTTILGRGGSNQGWRHVAFDNLAFQDSLSRVEYSIKLLDAVCEVLKTQIAAEEAHAQSAISTAHSLSTQLTASGSGQGVAKTLDGSKTQATGIASALTGLFGVSRSNASAAPSLSDVGNGPSSLLSALRGWSSVLTDAAQQRVNAVARLKTELDALRKLRQQRADFVEPLLQRASSRISDSQAKARTCEQCQARLDRGRKALADAEAAVLAYSKHPSPTPAQQADLSKRQGAAMSELESAQTAVLASTESLVAARRQRDQDLTMVARELQRYDEECQAALVRTLVRIAGLSSEEASVSQVFSNRLAEAANSVSLQSDNRTFLYQRRIALLLQEQLTRLDARAGADTALSHGLAEDQSIVPQPVPVSVAVRHGKEFLEADANLAPIMATWVAHILEGKGSDKWPDGTSSSGAEASPTFDVVHLAEHAARIAILKVLNQQRSINKDIGQAFPRLARVLWWLLDAADAQEDVCCARITMIMAETFYRLVEGRPGEGEGCASTSDGAGQSARADSSSRRGDRQFLQEFLKHHPVWRREGLWEEIFYESLYEATKASGAAALSAMTHTGGGSTAAAVPAGGSNRPGSVDFNHAYTQTVLSNLAAVAMNMTTFGVPGPAVQRIISGLARANGLQQDMIGPLLNIGGVEN